MDSKKSSETHTQPFAGMRGPSNLTVLTDRQIGHLLRQSHTYTLDADQATFFRLKFSGVHFVRQEDKTLER